MSRCYFLKTDYHVDFIGMQETLEMIFNCDSDSIEYPVEFHELEPSEGEREVACFYIKGESARGVHIINKEGEIVIKINSLCNHMDYALARQILTIERDYLKTQVIDEDGQIIPKEYFTDEKIQELREEDAKTVLVALKNIVKDYMQIFGVVRKVYFGKAITQKLIQYENEPKALVDAFEAIIHHVQYELPEYNMPGAALVRPKDSEDEKDFMLIRMMFEGNPYILQDYDYLMLRPDEATKEVIFIDNDDLAEIAPQLFDKASEFEFADDFTMVFPKLEGNAWKLFIELAREKNHKELLDAQPAAKAVNLTPDYDPDSAEADETSCQCHGDHWDCILKNKEEEFAKILSDSIEKGSLYAQAETDYTLNAKLHGKVVILEFDAEDSTSPITVRNVIAQDNDNKLSLVSGYPVVRQGVLIPLKITEIKEWENGLEAWVTGELADERTITFFDADYAVNKDKYEIGKIMDFIIGALAYFANEPESKGFKFEGQQAIDFKAKLGEKPEYDEEGNVKPVEFSTESLCAFLQAGHAPDDVEFITTVEEVKTITALGNNYWSFNTIYRGEDDNEEEIPTYVLKSEENNSLNEATQLQGLIWLTGYLVRN